MFVPTELLLGLFAIAASIRFNVRRDPAAVPLVWTLCLATLFVGFAGCALGAIHTLAAAVEIATPGDPGWKLVFQGFSEALYNPVGALTCCAFAAIGTAIGHLCAKAS